MPSKNVLQERETLPPKMGREEKCFRHCWIRFLLRVKVFWRYFHGTVNCPRRKSILCIRAEVQKEILGRKVEVFSLAHKIAKHSLFIRAQRPIMCRHEIRAESTLTRPKAAVL